MALNGIMIGTSILSTASLGVPINMGVNITFHIHIIRTITMEPMISDVIAVFFRAIPFIYISGHYGKEARGENMHHNADYAALRAYGKTLYK